MVRDLFSRLRKGRRQNRDSTSVSSQPRKSPSNGRGLSTHQSASFSSRRKPSSSKRKKKKSTRGFFFISFKRTSHSNKTVITVETSASSNEPPCAQSQEENNTRQPDSSSIAHSENRWRPRFIKESSDISLAAVETRSFDSRTYHTDAAHRVVTKPINTMLQIIDTPSILSNQFSEPDYSLTSDAARQQPCIACGTARRTHLALPCMHFAYCEDCCTGMQEDGCDCCMVCQRSGVSFTEVFLP